MKQYKIEGDPFSKLNQLFKEGSEAADGAAKIELATVTKSAPDLEITLDSDGLLLDKDTLIVAEHLTRHERIVSVKYTFPQLVELGDKTADTASNRNNIGQAPDIPYENYEMQYATMTFEDVLKVGDRILVACLDADMTYIILDRAVFY